MRCQASIWRWSPFLGICLSRSSAAIGWMTKGAQVTASAGPGAALRPCQCACGPSPRLETMPTPVIQASRAVSAAVSPIGQRLHREGERGRGLFHVLAEFLVREFNDTERDFSVASELA